MDEQFIKTHTGAIEDTPDDRDFQVSSFSPTLTAVDLEHLGLIKQVRNQRYNDCVVCSLNSMFEIEYLIKYNKDIQIKSVYGLSTGYGYTEARKDYKTFPDNTGLIPRNVLKLYNHKGIAPEYFLRYRDYNLSMDTDYKQKFTANFLKVNRYEAVSPNQLPYVLSSGKPVMIAINLDGNFISSKPGEVLTKSDGKNYGGHAMVAVGQRLEPNGPVIKILNSWGTGHGSRGYYYATLDYLLETAGNRLFWVIYV